MRIFREAFVGVIIALSTSLLVLGALILGITEGMVVLVPIEATPTTGVDIIATLFPDLATATPARFLITATLPAAGCAVKPPSNWGSYKVASGDTVKSLAEARGISQEDLMKYNCLGNESLSLSLLVGKNILLPPIPPTATVPPPTATWTDTAVPTLTQATVRSCQPPRGWVLITVQAGDYLTQLGRIYGTTADAIAQANCIGKYDIIRPGQRLYVPNVAPRYTATNPPPATAVPPTAVPPSATYTRTPAASSTTAPTATASRTATATTTATTTKTSTATFTRTPSPTATFTFTPTRTFTTSPTSTSTTIGMSNNNNLFGQ